MFIHFHFNDGMSASQEVPDGVEVTGNGNFFEEARRGREENGKITIPDGEGGEIVREYKDLLSIEITFK